MVWRVAFSNQCVLWHSCKWPICTSAQIWLNFKVFHRDKNFFHTLVGFENNFPLSGHIPFFEHHKHFLSICLQSMQNCFKVYVHCHSEVQTLKLFGRGIGITTHWVANYIGQMSEKRQCSKTNSLSVCICDSFVWKNGKCYCTLWVWQW